MYPDDLNGDVFRRMEADNFDFSIEHPVEFYAVYATEQEADLIARQYVKDRKEGQKFVNIETFPCEDGGMELELVPVMMVTYENIVAFEKTLTERTSEVEGYLDGWGIISD
jgi:hypothetical protein